MMTSRSPVHASTMYQHKPMWWYVAHRVAHGGGGTGLTPTCAVTAMVSRAVRINRIALISLP
jgi:hypothetical protein